MIPTPTASSNTLESQFLVEMEGAIAVVAKLARIYGSDAADVDDLRQEILLQAWRAYPTFGQRSRFSTWLYSIGVHVCLGWTRTKTRRAQRENAFRETNFHDAAPATPAANAALNPAVELLYDAIRLLEPIDRSLITLHLDGYANAEIAELLGVVSAGAVATRISRIRTQLKQTLNPTT